MEHKEHQHHTHKPDKVYAVKKETVWQVVSAVLAVAVLYLYFTGGKTSQFVPDSAQQPQPSQQPAAQQPTQQAPPSKQEIDLDDDPVLGDENAPVTIVEFSDFQCSFCKRAFDQSVTALKREYIDTGQVKLVYRDYPLPFHSEAAPAAEAAECAHDQGKFWEYHDALFKNQQSLGSDLYTELAEELGLDVNEFKSCMESGKHKEEVQSDMSYGSQVGVSGTPTFFINGIKLVGAQPFQAFQQIIEAELAG